MCIANQIYQNFEFGSSLGKLGMGKQAIAHFSMLSGVETSAQLTQEEKVSSLAHTSILTGWETGARSFFHVEQSLKLSVEGSG